MTILVVRTDKLGDFITALPTCYALKQADPSHHIVVCIAPLNCELAEACTFIDEVIVDDGGPLRVLVSKLKTASIDASVTLFSNTRVALAQFLARILRRIAPATKLAQFLYTDRVVQRRSRVEMAEFEYNLQLAKVVTGQEAPRLPAPFLHFDDAKTVYDDFVDVHHIERSVVAFHVGFGGSSEANWNLDEYVELIDTVLAQNRYSVVLTFGPDEAELQAKMQEKLFGREVIYYRSESGLVTFAKLISGFRLFVSTSTGTYHLAAAVGTETLTFFGDSRFASVLRWKAISDEKLQHPYMLPADPDKRKKVFEEVKKMLELF